MFAKQRHEARLARVERKLDLIIEHLGIDLDRPPAGAEEIDSLLRAGRRVEAVRVYRRLHPGSSLAEAVDVIDERRDRLG